MKEKWDHNFYWVSLSNTWTKNEMKYLLDVSSNTIYTITSGQTTPFIFPTTNKNCTILMSSLNLIEDGNIMNLYEYNPNDNSYEKLYTYNSHFRMAFSNKKLWSFYLNEWFGMTLNEYTIDFNPFTSVLTKSYNLNFLSEIGDISMLMMMTIFNSSFFAIDDENLILNLFDPTSNCIHIIKMNVSGDDIIYELLFDINSEDSFSIGSGYYNTINDTIIFNLFDQYNDDDFIQKLVEYNLQGDLITTIELTNYDNFNMGFFNHNNSLNYMSINARNVYSGYTSFYKLDNSGSTYINELLIDKFIINFQQNTGCINISLPNVSKNYINDIKTFDGVNFLTLNNQTWGWGYNYNNTLGINSSDVFIIEPAKVCGDHIFNKIETNYYNIGLDVFGNLWGWGYNYNGQLGNNSYDLTITPKKVYGNNKYIDFLTSETNTISLDKDGNVWEWGKKFVNYKVPNKINGNQSFININLISYYYAMALDNNNKAWTWGDNTSYPIGTIEEYNNSPLEVQGDHTFIKIISNEQGSVGIDNNNNVWSWGDNNVGQLGLGDQINRSTPAMISNHTFTEIYKDSYFRKDLTFAKDDNNILWGWGYNSTGILGVGSYAHKCTPTEIFGNHIFNDVYYEYGSIYAIDDSGKTWAWGNNSYGKSGTGFIGIYNSPKIVYGDHNFTEFYIQNYHTFGIDDSGQTWAWGYNLYGQLGVGNINSRITPVLIHSSPNFIKIYTSQTNTLALDINNNLWGWGSQSILGTNTFIYTPRLIFTGHTFKEIYISSEQSNFALAIDYSGQTWSWGNNSLGQLGQGDNINRSTPTLIHDKSFENIIIKQQLILGLDTSENLWQWGYSNFLDVNSNSPVKLNSIKYIQIFNSDVGASFAALDESGSTWMWGYSNNMIPIEYNRNTPFKVNINETIKNIAGSNEARFIYNDNKSWSWGNNYYGETGTGLISMIESPVEIYGNHTFCKIFNNVNSTTVFAVDNHNITWGWGENNNGQLGIGVVNCYTGVIKTPIRVCGNHIFNNIKTINCFTLGLEHSGQLWGWGSNYDGNLGLGDYDNRCTPVSVFGNHTFCDIFLTDRYSMAIDQNNSLWGWGYNGYGQLGCGDYENKNTPVSVFGNHTFCKISIDYRKVIAIDNNNEVWVWGKYLPGYETTGYLPILINNKTFCDVKIDSFSVYALDNNNKLWVWGDNTYGQLGTNNTEQQDIPFEIPNHTFCKIYVFEVSIT